MKVHCSLLTDHGPALTRSDLLAYEDLLSSEVESFLPFTSYSLYFPRTLENGSMAELAEGRAVFLADEKKVLLPLALNGALLGVFVARGARLSAPKAMPPLLASMARMCLEKLQLYKASITDARTGLGSADLLERTMVRDIERVGDSLRPDGQPLPGAEEADFCACFGLVLARLTNLEACAEKYGPGFAANTVAQAAEILRGAAPEHALCTRAGDDTLAVLLPGVTPASCLKTAEALGEALAGLRVKDPVLDDFVRPACSVGCAAYPNDMDGLALRKPADEQAALMLRKAARAAKAGQGVARAALPFSRIVAEGGCVLEAQPLGRVRVDFGLVVGAREGMRFLVWDTAPADDSAPIPKAEIALTQVGRGRSLAEVVHHDDQNRPVMPGDRLTLVRGIESEDGPEADGEDMLTGLLDYRAFLTHLATERDACERFSLVMLRLPDEAARDQRTAQTLLRELASACDATFGDTDDAATGGRINMGTLAWFLPGMTGKKAASQCRVLTESLPDDFPAPAIGVAQFPWLSFSRSQAMDNAHKALEYARLLPSPHVGLLDSLALNIHADKLFAQGRLFDAMEEYKLALTADRGNTMARNSLGVCHARNGDLAAAKRQFKTVLGHKPADVFALYNYGYACQRMGQIKDARKAYKQCLKADSKHIFSLIRLGQLSQKGKRYADARRYFERAAAIPGGEGLTRRYLANLALTRGDVEEAREHLHQALIHDPKDAPSLHLMARLYLDNGEDPEVAEVLARQAAALVPSHAPFWRLLARALDARGRTDEASEALARAEAL